MRGNHAAKMLAGSVAAYLLASTVGGCSPGAADAKPPTVWVAPSPSIASQAPIATASSSASVQIVPTKDAGPLGIDGGPLGVDECDDYVKNWNDCYSDPMRRAAAGPGLEQMIKAWRETIAQDPGKRAQLAEGCRIALDNFPRAACTPKAQ